MYLLPLSILSAPDPYFRFWPDDIESCNLSCSLNIVHDSYSLHMPFVFFFASKQVGKNIRYSGIRQSNKNNIIKVVMY